MTYQAVCFDMDGVIVDSERYWKAVENTKIFPTAVPNSNLVASDITGMNVTDLYVYLVEQYEPTLSENEFITLYDNAAEELYTECVSLLDGFDELLKALRTSGMDLALVSSSPSRWIQLVLDRFHLDDAFDTVVSGEEIDGPSKPAPEVYERAAARLDLPSTQCIAVEDSTHGINAARSANMHCIGYHSEQTEAQDLAEAQAVAKSPAELHKQLTSLCT